MTAMLTHICLHVRSVQECTHFYQRYCGLELVEDRTEAGKGSAYLAEPGRDESLVLQVMGGGQDIVLAESDDRHFGFVVASRAEVDAIADMARADGCLVWKPDEYLPGAYLCTVRDPNGNHVEFSVGHPVPPG